MASPTRNTPELRGLNQEQPFSPIYSYAFVTDAVEGLIAVNVDTLADGEFRNNFFTRAVTFNPDGVLTGENDPAFKDYKKGNMLYTEKSYQDVVIECECRFSGEIARLTPSCSAASLPILARRALSSGHCLTLSLE